MNLYLLENIEEYRGYDCISNVVVSARSIEDAESIVKKEYCYMIFEADKEKSMCIGTSNRNIERVICTDILEG
jgi:hypothetical protein